jgi:hypothetical protein
MIEGEEIREVTKVTIDLDTYEKLIRADERNYVEREMTPQITEAITSKNYWYSKSEKLEEERDTLRKALDEAKAQIAEMLGIKELEQVKLAEMQFEKGVANDAEQVAG